MRRVATRNGCTYGVSTYRSSSSVVCHVAKGNVAPAWYIEKWGGGNSCCSPSCCPSYISVMCLHRSTSSASGVKIGMGESLTTIGVDSDDMHCHHLDNMAHPLTCQVIFNVCIQNGMHQ